MKFYKWMAKLSVFALIFSSSSILQANSEFSYYYADESQNLTFSPEYPLEWQSPNFEGIAGVLDY